MAALARRWPLAGLLLAVTLSLGCNPFLSLFFLLPNTEPKLAPEFPLVTPEKKEAKVVALADYVGEMHPEFIKVDHELNTQFCRKLQEACKENKEKITVVPAYKVASFKDKNPTWTTMGLHEVGKHFAADYVIHMEINKLSFFEPGSRNDLYRGRAAVSVTVVDVSQPEEEAIFAKEYTVTYPDVRGPIPVDSTNMTKFRQEFLGRMATDLTWLFTPHLVADQHHCD